MKIQTKLIIIVAFLSILCTTPAVILYYRSLSFDKNFSQISQTINSFTNASELNSLSQFIRYYDEVLTQSARNYAFTGDVFWKNRYNNAVPELDSKIKEAIDRGTPEDKTIFKSIDAANQALIIMEIKSIDLVDKNQKTQAQKILNSEDYSQQKTIYQNGLEKYVTSRGEGYNNNLTVFTKTINNLINISKQNQIISGFIILIISFFCIIAGITVYLFIHFLIFRPLTKVIKATAEVTKGNLDYKIENNKKDEIGELSASFNQMAINLKDSKENIEQQVSQKTADLQEINKHMVNRELKMIELKQKIREVEKKNKK